MSQRADRAIGLNSITSGTDLRRSFISNRIEGGTRLDLFAAAVALALPLAISPIVASYTFTPKFAILLVVMAVGVPRLVHLGIERDRTAWAGTMFLFIAVLSAAASPNPLVGIFGLYAAGTGSLFWVAVIAAWAIGRSLTDTGKTLVVDALIVAAAVNAVVAIVQQLLQLSSPVLGLFDGTQADGLTGSPIFLESFLLGAMALVLVKACRGDWRWTPVAALLSGALELSGERFAIPLIGVLVVFSLGFYRNRRSVEFTGAVTAAYALAYVCVLSVHSSLDRNVTSNPRILLWKALGHAFLHRPILGFGPGQTGIASTRYSTLALARKLPVGTYFNDAHDILIEVALTTGLLGLFAFLAFVVPSLVASSGPLLGFAGLAVAIEFLEPLNIGVTPLVFLALGASMPAAKRTHTATRSLIATRLSALVLVVTVVASGAMLYGDYELNSAISHYSYIAARRGAMVLTFWASAELVPAQVAQYEADVVAPNRERYWLENVRKWEQTAVDRAPTDTGLVVGLAAADADLRLNDLAQQTYQRALALDEFNVDALTGLAQLELSMHDRAYAAALLRRARAINPAYVDQRH